MKIYIADHNPNGHIIECNKVMIDVKTNSLIIMEVKKPSLNELPIALSLVYMIED